MAHAALAQVISVPPSRLHGYFSLCAGYHFSFVVIPFEEELLRESGEEQQARKKNKCYLQMLLV